jgi:enoyl-CoA hydratase/carnithine racemase
MSDEKILLREDHDGITTLRMNRPGARNALSTGLMAEIQRELDAIRADESVRVVVIAGNGPAFSAGHDLREVLELNDPNSQEALLAQCSTMMQSIMTLPQPVIARVHGVATAAGCQLVATCDLAVASTEARFATPGVNIGLFCSTPMVALSRNVSRKHAMEMLMTGELMGAEDAVRFGLVNHAVAPDDLDAEVQRLAGLIASKSPLTLRIGKQAFYKQLESGVSDAYAYASAVMLRNLLANDAREGISAFIEKREPKWTGT